MSTFLFPRRELYAPGHFGNGYEVAGNFEMQDLLTESKWWGFNWYADWFDTVNLTKKSYLPEKVSQCWLTKVMWERKKLFYQMAQSLGFKLDLLITPNHVFVDQCREDLRAKMVRHFGQGLCPSIPEARGIILGNHDEWFRDLRESGIHLDALTACPFDFGGCECEKCEPWILTFAKLAHEIHSVAERYFPGLELRFCGWWWSPEEHDLFADWSDQNAPGRSHGMALWIKYVEDRPASVPPGRLPKGCKTDFFLHLGYSDTLTVTDLYGQWGPPVSVERIPRTLVNLKAGGGEGFLAYSEGFFDDVNKALAGGLSSGQFGAAKDVLEAYAERYFQAGPAERRQWAEWLAQWKDSATVELTQARRELDSLINRAPDTWRVKQWGHKLRMFEINRELETTRGNTPARKARAEEFFREREKLMRGLFGVHPMSPSVFTPIVGFPAWHKELYEAPTPIGQRTSTQA